MSALLKRGTFKRILKELYEKPTPKTAIDKQ